jgi:hypothetical protein
MRTATRASARFASAALALTLSTWTAAALADPPPAANAAPNAAPTAAAEDASTRFKRGLQLFDDGDYTLALVEFERAYQLAPNYRALYNIGLVDVQLGRYADASRTFEQYLHDGGDGVPEPRKAEVTKTLGELKLRTATVELSTNAPNAEVTLDGKPLETARLRGPMLIDAGEHTLRATATGFQASYRTMTLAGADHVTVRLQLVPVPVIVQHEAPAERGRTLFWPGLVATGAFAAGAIVSGVITLNAHASWSQLDDSPNPNASQLKSDATQVNSAALAADILTGLAVISAGTSLYLSLRVDHSPKSPSVGISPSQIFLSGTF